MKINRKLLLASTIFLPTGSVLAQQIADLDTIYVESVNRVETPISEVSRSVSVVTREDIEKQQLIDRSVGEILSKTVPGFSQSTEALTDFGQTLRGRTFLTLIDGVPQTMPLRDGRRSLNSIDASAIEQIEVVRGGNAVYGFGASGGVVNIITKRPASGDREIDLDIGAKTSLTETGSDALGWSTGVSASGRNGSVDYLLNGSVLSTGSSFDSDGDRRPADPTGAQGGIDDSDALNFLGKIGLESDGGDQRIEVMVNFYDFAQDSEFAGLATGGDPVLDIKSMAQEGNTNVKDPGTENRTLNLNYNNKAIFGSTGFDAQLYTGDLTTTYSKFPGFSQTEIASEKTGLRLTFDSPLGGDEGPASLIWGLDYLDDKTTQTALDGPQDSPILDQDALAYFAQLEVSVGDRGEISFGARQEDIDVDASDFSRDEGVTTVQGGTLTFSETLYNLSGTFYLSDNWDIYGGYSEGFTLGDIGRSISDGTFATAKEFESEAQKTENVELGIRAEYDSWNASLTFFTSDSDNGTSFDEDLNILKQPEEIDGVELAVDLAAGANFSFGGTVTVIEGETDTNNDGNFDEDLPTTRIPPTKITLYAEHAPTENWLYRLQGTYSGSREPTSAAFGGTSDIDSYFLLDLFARTLIGPGTLSIGIENLLNEDYTPVINQAYDLDFAYIRGPGTSLAMNYRWKF